MPQTLNDDWYDALGGKANAKKVYKTWIDRLANLTVLPQSENSSVGNSSFSEKLKCYKDNTLLGIANVSDFGRLKYQAKPLV